MASTTDQVPNASPREQGGLRAVYLKLGGSLITDKRQAETARTDVLVQLATEVAQVRRRRPDLPLILGHGSGSFGHVVGRRYGVRQGVTTAQGWYGFAATAHAAARLNRLVTGALLDAGLPAWSIQPGAALRCCDGRVTDGPAESVQMALERGLLPVLFGDVALDSVRGGTIASTEEIFAWLATLIPPARMVLAGEVDGVYTADPQQDPSARRIPVIGPQMNPETAALLGGSHGVDVTGGMAAKVAEARQMVRRHPGLEIIICSGLQVGVLSTAILDDEPQVGTRIIG